MKAWLMDSDTTNQYALHQRTPNVEVSPDELKAIGVEYWHIDPETGMDAVEALCKERNYKNRDEVKITNQFPQEKLTMFFNEHLHEDEEIRYILGGTGFFDVRNSKDEWVRIHVSKGDLLVLPAGIYHRFTIDESGFAHAMRLFKEEPKWTAINRPADENQFRQQYISAFLSA